MIIRYTVTNQSGAKLQLISYGAAVTSLWVPDRNGKLDDIVLGFDDIDGKSQINSARTNILK